MCTQLFGKPHSSWDWHISSWDSVFQIPAQRLVNCWSHFDYMRMVLTNLTSHFKEVFEHMKICLQAHLETYICCRKNYSCAWCKHPWQMTRAAMLWWMQKPYPHIFKQGQTELISKPKFGWNLVTQHVSDLTVTSETPCINIARYLCV